MTDQLPALISPGALAASADNLPVPVLVANAGDGAGWRYIEFFAANIRNPHTRRAYARACSSFFAWCEHRGLTLTAIRPYDVAGYVEQLLRVPRPPNDRPLSAPSVKQELAAVRMLFDWLVTGQIVPMNPAAAVRGPKHVVKTGKTPVLDPADWRKLIDSIPAETVRDLRDRALIATLTYSFARITAALTQPPNSAGPGARPAAARRPRDRLVPRRRPPQ
jgi:site-specific recombinase XerD